MHTSPYTCMHISHTHITCTSLLHTLWISPNYPQTPNRNLSLKIHLLEDMERNQFIHSRTSPFKVYSPKQIPPRLRKIIKGFKNYSIPFYQSSKFQTPQTLDLGSHIGQEFTQENMLINLSQGLFQNHLHLLNSSIHMTPRNILT